MLDVRRLRLLRDLSRLGTIAAVGFVLAFVFGLNQQAGGSPPPIIVPPGARFDENGVTTA